jgi:hypothetical protein
MILREPLLVLYALAQTTSCIAAISNRTIDDGRGDEATGVLPIYQPSDEWNTANGWNIVVVGTSYVYAVFLVLTKDRKVIALSVVRNSIPANRTILRGMTALVCALRPRGVLSLLPYSLRVRK